MNIFIRWISGERRHMMNKTVDEVQGQLIIRGGEVSLNINMSSIWTALIKEAAKCESYASDVLIDIDTVRMKLKSDNTDDFTQYFGFRTNGVDHEEFIRNRGSDAYRKIMAVHVAYEKYGDTGYEKCYFISVDLSEINPA